jgi:glycosyltransferase involved in cell wall biosynthesis
VLDECWGNTKREALLIGSLLPDFKLITKDKKEGLAKAKNFGLKHCTGDWVGFLDADDIYYSKDKLKRQVDFISTNPEYGVVACQAVDVYNAGTDKEYIQDNCFALGQYLDHQQIKERLPYENCIAHGSVLIRRQLLLDNGGYPEEPTFLGKEDWALWHELLNRGTKFYNLPFRDYGYSMGTSVER